MKCQYCNNEVQYGMKKCPACGAPIDASAWRAQPQAQTRPQQQLFYPRQQQQQNVRHKFTPQSAQTDNDDETNNWMLALSVLIPIVGFIWSIICYMQGKSKSGSIYLAVAVISIFLDIWIFGLEE